MYMRTTNEKDSFFLYGFLINLKVSDVWTYKGTLKPKNNIKNATGFLIQIKENPSPFNLM